MDTDIAQASEFFASYRQALLRRDIDAIAAHYGCPALIAFPGQPLAVTDPRQTRDFFASAIQQYDDVTDATPQVTIMGTAPGSLWVDVTWDYGDAAPQEHMCYQLLGTADSWKIGVLTPM